MTVQISDNLNKQQLYKMFVQCLLNSLIRPLLCVQYYTGCQEYQKKTHVFSLMKLIFCQKNATSYFKFCVMCSCSIWDSMGKECFDGSISFWRSCSWLLFFFLEEKNKKSTCSPKKMRKKPDSHNQPKSQSVVGRKGSKFQEKWVVSICKEIFLRTRT